MLTEAALSFLGLGVPPPDPSWGRMLKEGSEGFLEAAPWLTIFPGLALTALVVLRGAHRGWGAGLFGPAAAVGWGHPSPDGLLPSQE